MNATILNISNAGNGSLSVMASFVDDNGQLLNYNNVSWNGQPAIQFMFPIPTNSPTFTDDMLATISTEVQNRLNTEFTNWIGNNASSQAIAYLTPLLVGTTYSQITATVGNVVLGINNGAASITAVAGLQTGGLSGAQASTPS